MGLIRLLIAVFPASIYMATSDVVITGDPAWMDTPFDAATWALLPFQAVFVVWAWWYT